MHKLKILAGVSVVLACALLFAAAPEQEQALPMVIHHPDRRPVAYYIISAWQKRSEKNPRGYLSDPNLDALNPAIFRTRMLAWANQMKDRMLSRPIRHQGVIIWDVEGQEFNPPVTYLGDPRVLGAGYAPEMNAVADDLFAVFRNAGFRVGVTIRPEFVRFGKELPANCRFDPDDTFKDYFILIGRPFGEAFHGCMDSAGQGWKLFPSGYGRQTYIPQEREPEVIQLLADKAAYAHTRWGATLFYIDSTIWRNGRWFRADVFKPLQLRFPDSVFIPEEGLMDDQSVAWPLSIAAPKNPMVCSPPAWRAVYPAGALAVSMTPACSGTCLTDRLSNLKLGQKTGDVAMYDVHNLTWTAEVESMIQQARKEASVVTVIDSSSGQQYAFNGHPNDILEYPVQMRVYFAPSADGLESSSVFCGAVQPNGNTSCSLDLRSLAAAQIRYYDFTGKLVRSEAPSGSQESKAQ